VKSCSSHGIDLNGNSSAPSVSNCTVQGCAGWAIVNTRLDSVDGFTNNTATGNGANILWVNQATLASDTSLGPQNGINGVISIGAHLIVPATRTLTLAAGTTVKLANGVQINVDGTLAANGALGNKVVFTDLRDDTAGGDSNGDGGASSPSAGYWYGIYLNDGADATSLSNFEVRYAGYAGYAGIELATCNASLTNGVIRNCSSSGIDLNSTSSYPSVSGCLVQNSNGVAIRGVRLDAVPGFSNNEATGNAANALLVEQATLAASASIAPGNCIDDTLWISSHVVVGAGKTLSLAAGTVLKLGNGLYLQIDGTLNATGSAGNPVIFTDLRDDTAGGDTNGDGGASSPAPGYWYCIFMNDGSDASTLSNVEVRYAGYGGYGALELTTSNAALAQVKVKSCSSSGIELNNSPAYPAITGCTVQNCGGYAIRGVRLDAVPGFTSNTATGNGFNTMLVEQSSIAFNVSIAPVNCLGRTIVCTNHVIVPAGMQLSFAADTVVKLVNGAYVQVAGTLTAQGASGSLVVFTDFRDDSAGGDANGDGPSSGSPGWWYGIFFEPTSDASSLDFFEVRYAGYGGYAALEITDSDCTVQRGIVRHGSASAIDLNNTQAKPRINRCQLHNNAGWAITGAAIDATPYITRNTGYSNGYDQILVTDCTPAADLFIEGGAGVNDVIVLSTHLVVPAGITLRLGPSASFKMVNGAYVSIDGRLEALGLENEPITFTDYRDDSIGGDSNGDGPSSGSPGYWYGMFLQSGSGPNSLEHVHVRYPGYGGYPGITNLASSSSLAHCRVERGSAGGYVFQGAARADFLVAWSCGSTGVRLDSGAFDLRHATVSACGFGVQRNGAGWSGSIVDSIAWGNTTNYLSVPAGQIRFSNGYSGGGTGNIDVDPLFSDAPNGDLHLAAGSPCIGTGDPFSDLDADCSTSDMGAYPALSAAAPVVYCVGKQNSSGCVPYVGVSGFASVSSSAQFWLRAFDVVNNKNGLFFYGFSGRSSTPFQGGTKCVASPVKRLPIVSSGGHAGANDCSGVIEFEFNAMIQSGTDPLLLPGATVNAQCWYRDPGVFSNTGLSNAVEFRVCN